MESTRPSAHGERRARPRDGVLEHFLDALYPLLRWIRRTVTGLYAALGLFLLLGFVAALAATGLFALVARLMASGATERADRAVLVWLHAHASPPIDALALLGAALGSGAALWAVLLLGSLYLLWSRHLYSLALLWVSLVGGRALQGVLKAAFQRPRPHLFGDELHLLGRTFHYPTSESFPSGHALTAMVVYGTLAYLVARLEPSVRLRRWTLLGALVLVVEIGLSRLYLGVHYPSDVAAGWLVGFVWATTCALAIELVRMLAGRHPEARRAERDLDRGLEPLRRAVEGPEG
jgi:undecaprenyl-diphosphatase